MDAAEVLASLTARFAGAKTGHISITADEVAEELSLTLIPLSILALTSPVSLSL